MHCTRTIWQLGMPHTICGALGEVALLAQAQHLHWSEIGTLTGCAASRLRDAAGDAVYASVYFAELDAGPEGLAAFAPDDTVALLGALGRYGPSILDGVHLLRPAGAAGEAPAAPDAAVPPLVRISFVLVSSGGGIDALRIAAPANAPIDRIPALPREPDSYRLIKEAKAAGHLGPRPRAARPLWDGRVVRVYPINPDRDLNGVGLLYFANYVTFLDAAEREALAARAGVAPEHLPARVTMRRRIAYYGNALPTDRLEIGVEAFADPDDARRLTVLHDVRRVSDGRLIALARAERRLGAAGSEPIE